MAKENVSWFSPWKKVLDWKPPYAKWFVGAKTNVSYNCLDRHLEGDDPWRRNKAAIIWEGEPGDSRVITYAELHREVCRFANVLKARGIKKGDRVVLGVGRVLLDRVAVVLEGVVGAEGNLGVVAEVEGRARALDGHAHRVASHDPHVAPEVGRQRVEGAVAGRTALVREHGLGHRDGVRGVKVGAASPRGLVGVEESAGQLHAATGVGDPERAAVGRRRVLREGVVGGADAPEGRANGSAVG